MRKRIIWIPVVVLRSRTGFSAFSPAIDGCVATDKTIDRTLNRMKEALEFHFEGLQLVKSITRFPSEQALRKSFDEYGTDAFYATLKIAA